MVTNIRRQLELFPSKYMHLFRSLVRSQHSDFDFQSSQYAETDTIPAGRPLIDLDQSGHRQQFLVASFNYDN